ncbi:MAG: excinuclease subunit [Sphingomonas bacterium]|uniref:UvrB/UvrC motif-containing protein n=1 Tax=Sphingomonas bacterium TaxID=1895847 RepID=UPI0026304648|nr:UvrB/UvrC motif-containing protein [Sphingomonas bacterium]MDB5710351.1 excinuclease subunit [Sphingomonas bacterium]
MIGPSRDKAAASAVADLTREMEAAAAALDFEHARILRDRINLLRGGASPEDAMAADTAGLQRQHPGKMGIGTSQQRMTPPKDWRPPEKPDPMTRATGRRQSRKSTE